MVNSLRRSGILGLNFLLLAVTASDAFARQTTKFGGVNVNANPTIRPAFMISGNGFNFQVPSLTLGQYAYNTAFLGSAYRSVPPYALGYNPYGSALTTAPSLAGYGLSTLAEAAKTPDRKANFKEHAAKFGEEKKSDK